MDKQDLAGFGKKRLRPKRGQATELEEAELSEFERRRRADVVRASYELDQIDTRILELSLKHPAITQQEIADVIGISRQTVQNRLGAAKYKRALSVANRTAIEVFSANQAAAARRLAQLIHDPDPRVSLRACLAHLWPIIRAEAANSDQSDFAKFIAEAYELAERQKAKAVEDGADH